MITQTNDTAIPTLQNTIDEALLTLESYEATSDEYSTVVDQLVKLYKMKEIENSCNLKQKELDLNSAKSESETSLKQQELDNFDRVSKAQLATILANVAGIVAILSHERTHIIASKALGFVSKLK